MFSVILTEFKNVQIEGKVSKRLALEFESSNYKFKLSKDKRSQLMDFIENAKEFDKEYLVNHHKNKLHTNNKWTSNQLDTIFTEIMMFR